MWHSLWMICVILCKLWLLCWWWKPIDAVKIAWICQTVVLLQYQMSPNLNFPLSDVCCSNWIAWKIIDCWLKCLLIFCITNNETFGFFYVFQFFHLCYWCKLWHTFENRAYFWHAEWCLPEQLAVHTYRPVQRRNNFQTMCSQEIHIFWQKTYKLC